MKKTSAINHSQQNTSYPARTRGLTLVKFLAIVAVLGLLIAMLLPATRTAGPAAFRAHCRNHFKQLALAMHLYHDQWDAFPPAYITDEQGNRLHSWRTLLLPYLDQKALYDSIDLTKPWDHPDNTAARETPLEVFHCSASKRPETETTYSAIVGDEFCLKPTQTRPRADITDPHSATLMLVEMSDDLAVHWMSPEDSAAAFLMTLSKQTNLSHPGIINAAFVDGRTGMMPSAIDPGDLRALMTVAGGETVQPEF